MNSGLQYGVSDGCPHWSNIGDLTGLPANPGHGICESIHGQVDSSSCPRYHWNTRECSMTNGHLSRSDQGTSGKAESSCNVGAYALEMRILQSQVRQLCHYGTYLTTRSIETTKWTLQTRVTTGSSRILLRRQVVSSELHLSSLTLTESLMIFFSSI